MRLLTACIFMLCNICIAQESVSTVAVPVSKNIDASNWQTYAENANVKIEYMQVDCDPSSGMDFQGIMLRFTNLTSNQLDLTWHLDLDLMEHVEHVDLMNTIVHSFWLQTKLRKGIAIQTQIEHWIFS